jgi:hypothetical protein
VGHGEASSGPVGVAVHSDDPLRSDAHEHGVELVGGALKKGNAQMRGDPDGVSRERRRLP